MQRVGKGGGGVVSGAKCIEKGRVKKVASYLPVGS